MYSRGLTPSSFFEHLTEIESAVKADLVADLVDLQVGGGHQFLRSGDAGGSDKLHKTTLAVLCKKLA